MAKEAKRIKKQAVKTAKTKVLQNESSSDSEYSSQSISDLDLTLDDFCKSPQASAELDSGEIAVNKYCLTRLAEKRKCITV